jgi:hypothetical protein
MEEGIMSGPESSKKRISGKKSFILIGLLVLFVLQAGAEQKGKLVLGVYSGWSFGSGYEFS